MFVKPDKLKQLEHLKQEWYYIHVHVVLDKENNQKISKAIPLSESSR